MVECLVHRSGAGIKAGRKHGAGFSLVAHVVSADPFRSRANRLPYSLATCLCISAAGCLQLRAAGPGICRGCRLESPRLLPPRGQAPLCDAHRTRRRAGRPRPGCKISLPAVPADQCSSGQIRQIAAGICLLFLRSRFQKRSARSAQHAVYPGFPRTRTPPARPSSLLIPQLSNFQQRLCIRARNSVIAPNAFAEGVRVTCVKGLKGDRANRNSERRTAYGCGAALCRADPRRLSSRPVRRRFHLGVASGRLLLLSRRQTLVSPY